MLLSPVGAGTHPATTISPPYTGATVSPNTQWGSSGCGKGTITSYTKWSPATGVGSFGGSDVAKSACKHLGSVGGGGSGNTYGYWQLTIPVSLPSGTHSVQPNWTIAYAATEHYLITKACPTPVVPTTGNAYYYCNVDASFNFYFSGYMIDATNNSYFGGYPYSYYLSNYSYQDNNTYCYSGTCYNSNYSYGSPATVSASVPFTMYINGTFNASHVYHLIMYMDASAYARAQGYGSSLAVASITLHNGLTLTKLNSITVV